MNFLFLLHGFLMSLRRLVHSYYEVILMVPLTLNGSPVQRWLNAFSV